MAFLMEVMHTVSPATKKNFAEYVSCYGEVAVPLMQESGYEILGAWECLTGTLGRDMLLIRCGSMSQFEEASGKIQREIANGRTARLQSLGLSMEEEAQYGFLLEDNSAVGDSGNLHSKICLCIRINLKSSNYFAALEASKMSAQTSPVETGYELALTYSALSGRRGTYTEIWTSNHAVDMPQLATFSPHAENETLLELIESMTVDIIKPLPYSDSILRSQFARS